MNFKVIYYSIISFLLFVNNNLYASITSTQSGNWNSTSTWVGGVCPISTDEVVISSGHTVTVTANATCCTYYIQSGSILTINSGITLTCIPTTCTNTGISASDLFDNKGTISGLGTFYINCTSSAGSGPNYENNGIISVSNLTLNNSMSKAAFEDLMFTNGYDNVATITSTNIIIRNTTGNDIWLKNALSSTINSSTITIENLYTGGDSWVYLNNLSGTVTVTTVNLNNSHTSSARTYIDNSSTMTIDNLTTSQNSGYLQSYHASNGGVLNYTGASVHSSIYFDASTSTNTVNFNSSTVAQTIPQSRVYTSGATSNYSNLTLNNTYSTSPQFVMATNLDVYKTLTLTSGIVNMAGFRLSLGVSTPTSGTLSRTSGHFYSGTFRRYFTDGSSPTIGTAAGLFPMGTSYYSSTATSYYRPLWIGGTGLTTGSGISMDVTHTFTLPSSTTNVSHSDATWSGGTTLEAVSSAYWTTNRTFLSTTRAMRYGGEGFGTVTLTDLGAGQSTSAAVGSFSATTNASTDLEVNRTFTTSAAIDNNWYIGTKNKTQSTLVPIVLPIELLEFNVLPDNSLKQVTITWSTASEVNNEKFILERSNDGFVFYPIDSINGSKKSNVVLNYTSTDTDLHNGLYYYRLKQVDIDGSFTYSKIEAINLDIDFSLCIIPNPNDGKHGNLVITGIEFQNVDLFIYDLAGKIVYEKVINIDESNHHQIPFSILELPIGSYIIHAVSQNETLIHKMIIE